MFILHFQIQFTIMRCRVYIYISPKSGQNPAVEMLYFQSSTASKDNNTETLIQSFDEEPKLLHSPNIVCR